MTPKNDDLEKKEADLMSKLDPQKEKKEVVKPADDHKAISAKVNELSNSKEPAVEIRTKPLDKTNPSFNLENEEIKRMSEKLNDQLPESEASPTPTKNEKS